jgi:hypothetical protein
MDPAPTSSGPDGLAPSDVREDSAMVSDETGGVVHDAEGDAGSDVVAEVDAAECSIAMPTEDCPCDVGPIPDACCLGVGYGLWCNSVSGKWDTFWDCGCSAKPECAAYPIYALCGMEP